MVTKEDIVKTINEYTPELIDFVNYLFEKNIYFFIENTFRTSISTFFDDEENEKVEVLKNEICVMPSNEFLTQYIVSIDIDEDTDISKIMVCIDQNIIFITEDVKKVIEYFDNLIKLQGENNE